MKPRIYQSWSVSRNYQQWGITLTSCLGSIYITGIEWRNINIFSPILTPKSQFQSPIFVIIYSGFPCPPPELFLLFDK